jgi:hypothetical protein
MAGMSGDKLKGAVLILITEIGRYLIYDHDENDDDSNDDNMKHVTEMIVCCCRDASRELVLAHVKEHYQQRLQQASSGGGGSGGGGGGGGGGGVSNSDSAEASVRRGHAPFRCGHCHQVSNWKHVIQVQLTTFTTNCMGSAVCVA